MYFISFRKRKINENFVPSVVLFVQNFVVVRIAGQLLFATVYLVVN